MVCYALAAQGVGEAGGSNSSSFPRRTSRQLSEIVAGFPPTAAARSPGGAAEAARRCDGCMRFPCKSSQLFPPEQDGWFPRLFLVTITAVYGLTPSATHPPLPPSSLVIWQNFKWHLH